MGINGEASLGDFLVRIAVIIPKTSTGLLSLRAILAATTYFTDRPALLKQIVTIKLVAGDDFEAGTINAAGDGFEVDSAQSDYLTTDPAPYQEPMVSSAALDIEALLALADIDVNAVAFCYMSAKINEALSHATVEVPV